MLSSTKKGFFSELNVRKILAQFWMSIKEVFTAIKLGVLTKGSQSQNLNITQKVLLNTEITKLNYKDELLLKNNFYLRLEFTARGKQIFEEYDYTNQYHLGSYSNLGSIESSKDTLGQN